VAGRDGFWLHRWLIAQGIDNMVVDSASIEVNRRARRAKTDRLDGGKLLTILVRYLGGERRVWSDMPVPTSEEEDERRAHRELEQLKRERTAHSNRIRALLVLHNLRAEHVGGRNWGKWWARHAPELPTDRLAALIPPPRRHRHRYYGVLTPNAPLRAAVTARAEGGPDAGCGSGSPGTHHNERITRGGRRTDPPPGGPICLGIVARPHL
jgi:transposase